MVTQSLQLQVACFYATVFLLLLLSPLPAIDCYSSCSALLRYQPFSPMARSAATTATKEATPPASSSPAPQQDNTDFLWTYTEEPHRTRRLAIIKAHPEVAPPVSLVSSISTWMLCSNKLLTAFNPGP